MTTTIWSTTIYRVINKGTCVASGRDLGRMLDIQDQYEDAELSEDTAPGKWIEVE